MDGKIFEGDVQRIILRTVHGDVAIMANHTDYCTAIGMGVARVTMEDGKERTAACIGGMLSVIEKKAHVIPTTCRVRAEAKLRRALVRIGTGGK